MRFYEKAISASTVFRLDNPFPQTDVVAIPSNIYHPPAVKPTESSATALKAWPNEITDIAEFGKCLNSQVDQIIYSLKKGNAGRPPVLVIDHPGQIAQLRYKLPELCKFQENDKTITLLNKVLRDKLVTHFPADKATAAIQAFNVLDQTPMSGSTKATLLEFFNLDIEIESKNIVMNGMVDSDHTKENVITYRLGNIGGDLALTYRKEGQQPISQSGSLRNSPFNNALFSFNFHGTKGVAGTLIVTVPQHKMGYDFTILKGDLEKFKSGQPIFIILTPDAWKKLLSIQTRMGVNLYSDEGLKVPLNMRIENSKENVNRTCELSAAEVKCKDADARVKFKIDLETIKKFSVSKQATP